MTAVLRRSLAAAAVGALALAGCSGGSGGGSAPAAAASKPTTAAAAPATAAAVPSAGCARPAGGALTGTKQTVTVAGVRRWWLLTAPAGSATPRPLVVDFHGLGEGAVVHTAMSQFPKLGQRDGFVVAEPNGTGTPLQWKINPDPAGNPDLVFVRTLLDTVEKTRCIDTSRVYATGLSMGAFMTSLVACTMADRFAAFAPVSGVQMAQPCATRRAVPLLTIHGTADPILHFNGGVDLSALTGGKAKPLPPANIDGAGYPATVRAWAAKDGCAAKPADTNVGPHVLLRTYSCPAGAAVEFYVVKGGGHAWPGSVFSAKIARIVGPTTFEIDATPLIWQFFQRFTLPAARS